MSMASVVSRTNCTSEPRRQRCAGDSGTPPRNSRKPMRVPTRCRAIARPCAAWGVRPGAGDVRRCGPGGEARRGDFEAFSKRNHLECGATS